ncbi:MAG: hypothetical protein OXF95_08055 [Rhodobacteraceae bacterium]|nr:hypothetical protein [Paracoccaceae bacterium]
MKFDTCPTSEGLGHILAHSIHAGGKKVKKGKILNKHDLDTFLDSGVREIMVARLEEGDIGEDEAASYLGKKLVSVEPSLFASSPFTGRVNIYSSKTGLIIFDSKRITDFNLVDEAITLATLPSLAKVEKNQLVGTIKIIPYGVAKSKVVEAAELLEGIVGFRQVELHQADLIITTHSGERDKLSEKGIEVTRARLQGLGIALELVIFVSHETRELSEALRGTSAPLILVMTSTATSDANDTGPRALRLAGGSVVRVGIPVDPGNLLFYGELDSQKVIGLPGCARSPTLNGADWVLERTVCGIDISPADFASMGAGGLLKEIPTRRQPRDRRTGPLKPNVQVILICDSNDRGFHSQLSKILASQVDGVSVVGKLTSEIMVKFANRESIRMVNLEGRSDKSNLVSLGMVSLPRKTDAVIFVNLLSEEISTDQLNRLISAFSPQDGREICKFGGENVPMGPPILFGRRFFENLRALDAGLRPNDLLQESRDFLVELDLD